MNSWKFGCFVLIALAFTLTTAISLRYNRPVGWDAYFHLYIANDWANGKIGMFSNITMNVNYMPYPPLFHLLLVPSIWLRLGFEFARFLQIIHYPFVLIASCWLLKKHYDWKTAFYGTTLLMANIGIFDYTFQAIPQALEMILYPLILHAFLSMKKKWFVGLSTAMIYTHGLASVSFIGGLVLHAFIEKRKKEALAIIILSLPIIIITGLYLPPAMARWGKMLDDEVEKMFWFNPLLLSATYQGLLIFGWAVSFYDAYHWRKLTQFQWSCILTIMTLLLMLLPWPNRFLGYVAMPFAYLMAPKMAHSKIWKVLLIPLFITFAYYYFIPWLMLATNDFIVLDFNPY